MVFFAMQKLITLIRSHLFIFALISSALGDQPKKTLLLFMLENAVPMFSSRSLMVSYLILKPFLKLLTVFKCSLQVQGEDRKGLSLAFPGS